jgi:hypothetical protein
MKAQLVDLFGLDDDPSNSDQVDALLFRLESDASSTLHAASRLPFFTSVDSESAKYFAAVEKTSTYH